MGNILFLFKRFTSTTRTTATKKRSKRKKNVIFLPNSFVIFTVIFPHVKRDLVLTFPWFEKSLFRFFC